MKDLKIFVDVKEDITVVYTTDHSELSDMIKDAIKDMSAEYNTLKFVGYMDGHHFNITDVINLYNNESLTEDEVNYMYYIAHGPECICIRINEPDFEEYMNFKL